MCHLVFHCMVITFSCYITPLKTCAVHIFALSERWEGWSKAGHVTTIGDHGLALNVLVYHMGTINTQMQMIWFGEIYVKDENMHLHHTPYLIIAPSVEYDEVWSMMNSTVCMKAVSASYTICFGAGPSQLHVLALMLHVLLTNNMAIEGEWTSCCCMCKMSS